LALSTFSKFYYGHVVVDSNRFINFNEGSGELAAELTRGYYSPSEYAAEVKRAMDSVGDLAYTVSFLRNTGQLQITSTANFSLLFATGSQVGESAGPLMGFSAIDLSGQSSYTSQNRSGSVYYPQFILQNYVDKDDSEALIDATVNKSANGQVEVIRFGVENFVEFNIRYITNKPTDGVVIKNNPNGISDARSFMKYLITKGRFEFMPNESDSNTFLTLQLERTPEDQNGTKYKLKEQVTRGLPDIYETGILVCRVI
jgi:hypothetical protein